MKEKYIEQARTIIAIIGDGSRGTQVLSSESGVNDSAERSDVSHDRGDGTSDEAVHKGGGIWPPELFKLDLPDTARATRYRVSVKGQKVSGTLCQVPL